MPKSRFQLGRRYTRDEMLEMIRNGEIRQAAFKGYVARADADGMLSFVHWTKANKPGKVHAISDEVVEELRAGLPPITKRTPQERVESFMSRIMADMKESGTVPGFSDENIRGIVGEAWKTGHTEVTSEMVRRVAQHFMEDAEAKAAERDRKRITRQ